MAQLFPKWTNRLPILVLAGLVFLLVFIVFIFWYYATPKYLEVGYRPEQPVPYSHKLHAGDMGMDCRYCHTNVEQSAHANVPSTQTCMNCHTNVATESEKLLLVRESWASGKPIEWVRVHSLPDYAYFDHSAHITAGVGCESCHGNVAAMEVVEQKKPLSMGWCLDCHREPEMHLRPREDITKMNWTPPPDQMDFAKKIIEEKNISPPTDCSGCHR
ncbi:MAG: cytochrome C [Caldithrix sp.]|nr:cytochrome C [Caldithrix sp.]